MTNMRTYNGEKRIYNGWKKEEISRDLIILSEIIQKPISVNEQIIEFKKLTHKNKRSFFRYKKYLLRETDWIGEHKLNIINSGCYFCNNDKNLITHHIDFNRKNNSIENLIILCESCHSKLHIILKKVTNIMSQIVNVS